MIELFKNNQLLLLLIIKYYLLLLLLFVTIAYYTFVDTHLVPYYPLRYPYAIPHTAFPEPLRSEAGARRQAGGVWGGVGVGRVGIWPQPGPTGNCCWPLALCPMPTQTRRLAAAG